MEPEPNDHQPKWLESSESAPFPGTDGSGPIDVQPDALKQFSVQTQAEADGFMKGLGNGVMPLMTQANQIGFSTDHSVTFMEWHSSMLMRLSQAMTDAGTGVAALSTGSLAIAINYLNCDATTASTMTDVQSAFSPTGPQNSMKSIYGASSTSGTGTQGNVSLPAPDPKVSAPSTSNVNAHRPQQTIPLGNDDTYLVPADDDIETTLDTEVTEARKSGMDHGQMWRPEKPPMPLAPGPELGTGQPPKPAGGVA